MIDLTVNVPTFEAYLAEEDTASLSHKGHSIKNGDQSGTKMTPVVSDAGSTTPDVIEKSDKAAPGDDKGTNLEKPPVS